MTSKQFSRLYPLRSRRVSLRRCGDRASAAFPMEIGPFVARFAERSLVGGGLFLSTGPFWADLEAYVHFTVPKAHVVMNYPVRVDHDRAQKELVSCLDYSAAIHVESAYKAFMKDYPDAGALRKMKNIQGYIRGRENLFGMFLLAQATANGFPDGKLVNKMEWAEIDSQAEYAALMQDVRDRVVAVQKRIDPGLFQITTSNWETEEALQLGLTGMFAARKLLSGVQQRMVWFHDIANTPIAPGVLATCLDAMEGSGVRFLGIAPAMYIEALRFEMGDTPIHALQLSAASVERPKSQLVMISDRPFQGDKSC